LIERLLDGARSSEGGALVLRGDPGIGKSALLAFAADRSPPMRLLRGVGVESESELPFAALHQILLPVLGLTDRLPPVPAHTILSAFALTDERVVDRFLISVAVLGLLSEAAGDNGLVCLIDDAHWIDPPSSEALVFVARRLAHENVALLFAARDEGT